jgi:hypothetical protein
MRADDVGAALESAVVGVLGEFGTTHDLGGLEWRVVDYPDGHVIEGRPLAAAETPVTDAQGWADALGMSEYEWAEDSCRSWHLEQGHWHFEVLSNRD